MKFYYCIFYLYVGLLKIGFSFNVVTEQNFSEKFKFRPETTKTG